jgi:hypothetical protein
MKSIYFKANLLITSFISIVAIIVIMFRGQLFPITDIDSAIKILNAPGYITLNIIMIFCYIIPFSSFYVINILLIDKGKTVLGYWGLLLSIIGTSIALTTLGVFTFAFPEITKINTADSQLIKMTLENIIMGASIKLGILSAFLYSIGPILLGIGLIKITKKYLFPALLLCIHGLLLSFGFSFWPLLVIGWASLGLSTLSLSLIKTDPAP